MDLSRFKPEAIQPARSMGFAQAHQRIRVKTADGNEYRAIALTPISSSDCTLLIDQNGKAWAMSNASGQIGNTRINRFTQIRPQAIRRPIPTENQSSVDLMLIGTSSFEFLDEPISGTSFYQNIYVRYYLTDGINLLLLYEPPDVMFPWDYINPIQEERLNGAFFSGIGDARELVRATSLFILDSSTFLVQFMPRRFDATERLATGSGSVDQKFRYRTFIIKNWQIETNVITEPQGTNEQINYPPELSEYNDWLVQETPFTTSSEGIGRGTCPIFAKARNLYPDWTFLNGDFSNVDAQIRPSQILWPRDYDSGTTTNENTFYRFGKTELFLTGYDWRYSTPTKTTDLEPILPFQNHKISSPYSGITWEDSLPVASPSSNSNNWTIADIKSGIAREPYTTYETVRHWRTDEILDDELSVITYKRWEP